MRRIAFFFVGADRSGMLEAVRRGELPDSALRGANFLAGRPGYSADTISTHAFEAALPRFLRARIPMPLLHLAFLPRLLHYDAVIASDGFLLGCAASLVGKFSRSRPKWILIAINTSVLIERHAAHPIHRAILRFCWNRYAAIVCLSDRQKHDLSRFGVRESLLSTIRFGVDTAYFKTDNPEGQFILSVGKDLGRDYATLLEAAGHTGLPVEIVASRKNIPSSANIPANVTIRYDAPLKELRSLYQSARLVVVASLPDGTPLGTDCSGQTVVLEALAAERAVIATRRAWLDEYLSDWEEYATVPPGDANALAEAMQKLWEDAPLRNRLAVRGARAVRGKYSSRRFAEDLIGLVEKLLS